MPVFTYLDASGDETLSTLSVAGLIAHESRWLEFEREWASVLVEFGVSELHMRHFTQFRGEFSSWRQAEDKRRRFLTRIAAVINERIDQSLVVTMFMRDYHSVNRAYKLREYLGGPYAFTALNALMLARAWRNGRHPDEPMAAYIERGDRDQGELLKILRTIEFEHPVTLLRKKTIGSDRGVAYVYPFQACDFIAYENAKAGKTSEELHTDEITARKSLSLIAPSERDPMWRYIDAKAIMAFCSPWGVLRVMEGQFDRVSHLPPRRSRNTLGANGTPRLRRTLVRG